MLERLRKLTKMPWHYGSPISTAAVAGVAVLGTVLARAVLPHSARPSGWHWVIVGSFGAYAGVRLGSYTGLSKRFKHEYLDRLGGEVDDAQTWMLAVLVGGGTLVASQAVRRAFGVPGPAGGKSCSPPPRRAGRRAPIAN